MDDPATLICHSRLIWRNIMDDRIEKIDLTKHYESDRKGTYSNPRVVFGFDLYDVAEKLNEVIDAVNKLPHGPIHG